MENIDDIKNNLQIKINFYKNIVDKTKTQIISMENICDRLCAVKSLMKLECLLFKYEHKLQNMSASCCQPKAKTCSCSEKQEYKKTSCRCKEEQDSCCK